MAPMILRLRVSIGRLRITLQSPRVFARISKRHRDRLCTVDDQLLVQCPYCFESMDFYVDPQTHGSYVEDCSVASPGACTCRETNKGSSLCS